MPIIRHNELKNFLSASTKEAFPSVSLLYGEEFLYKTALEDILTAILPPSKKSTHAESIEGTVEYLNEVIEKLNTFSLLQGNKAIILSESKFFYSTVDIDSMIEKAKSANEEDDMKTASRYLVTILGLLQFSFDDVTSGSGNKQLHMDKNSEWIHPVIRYCIEKNVSIPAGHGDTTHLERSIEKGFPKDNHLIITTDTVDKRHRLFKIISEKGLVVDCSVPKSDRAADKKAQESVTSEKARIILQKNKKTITTDAYHALYEMTGFDLRTFTSNLEKLISYVGDRKEITESDVRAILDRTKKDPIYELTNAIMERHTETALFYLSSLLSGGTVEHPLQILSAIINQIRRLLMIKDFTQSQYGKPWFKDCGYDQFRTEVMPAIVEYDSHLLTQIQACQFTASAPSSENKKKQKVSKKDRRIQHLFIAKNPNNPFPIYKSVKHSENFSKRQLINAFERLSDADTRLKTSPPASHKRILEEVVLAICQPAGA